MINMIRFLILTIICCHIVQQHEAQFLSPVLKNLLFQTANDDTNECAWRDEHGESCTPSLVSFVNDYGCNNTTNECSSGCGGGGGGYDGGDGSDTDSSLNIVYSYLPNTVFIRLVLQNENSYDVPEEVLDAYGMYEKRGPPIKQFEISYASILSSAKPEFFLGIEAEKPEGYRTCYRTMRSSEKTGFNAVIPYGSRRVRLYPIYLCNEKQIIEDYPTMVYMSNQLGVPVNVTLSCMSPDHFFKPKTLILDAGTSNFIPCIVSEGYPYIRIVQYMSSVPFTVHMIWPSCYTPISPKSEACSGSMEPWQTSAVEYSHPFLHLYTWYTDIINMKRGYQFDFQIKPVA